MRLNRTGFTLIEMTIVMAIMALLAVVLAPEIISRLSRGEAAAISSSVNAVSDGIESFRSDVLRYPKTLAELTQQPTASSVDSCNRPIPAAHINTWSGPYLTREVPAGGIVAGGGVIRTAIRRDPETYSSVATLFIDVDGVDRAVAEQLEASYDGNADFTSGAIRWNADSGPDRGRLSYGVPIRGC